MGESKSFAELALKFERTAKNLAEPRKTVQYAAEQAQKRMDGVIRQKVPDLDMSGLSSSKTRTGKRKSGKVGTRVTRIGKNGSSVAVVAVGAMHWLEGGTRPHLTGVGRMNASGEARRTKKGNFRKGQQRRMNFPGGPDGWRVGPFKHPGTRPQHVWTKAIKAAVPVVEDVFSKSTEKALREVFG